MVHRIAILVILVCLSGSSFSRSWVGFEDHDYFESSLADTDGSELNRKSRHYAWDSDEDDDSSEHHGYGYEYDRPNSNDEENHYGHDNGYSSHVNHGYHHHGYHHHGHNHDHYNDNHGYNHHGYHDNKDVHGQPGSTNWNSYVYNQGHRNPDTHVETPGHSHHKGHGDQNKKPDAGSGGSTQNDLNQMLYTNIHANQGSSHYGSHGQPGQHYGSQGPNQAGSSGWQNRGLQNSWNVGIVGPNDADRVVFPGSNNQIPTTRGPAVTTTVTTRRPSTTSTRTTSSTRTPTTARPSTTLTTSRTTVINTTLLNLVLCVRACPTTPEYNPVCGSNSVTYNNPGALQCAANCGINVSLSRRAPCSLLSPSSTTTSTTTSRPSTTTERPKSTSIPLDVILSIFGQPTDSNTEEAEFDIDKRRETKQN